MSKTNIKVIRLYILEPPENKRLSIDFKGQVRLWLGYNRTIPE
jgi:hypothetical protein